MRVVETHQTIAVRIMQGKRVTQAMRSLRRRGNAFNLELKPVASFEMMDAAIKRQQEFQCMLVRDGRPS